MKHFLKGCLVVLYIVFVMAICVGWFYVFTLIPSTLVRLLYVIGTIILGWYMNS